MLTLDAKLSDRCAGEIDEGADVMSIGLEVPFAVVTVAAGEGSALIVLGLNSGCGGGGCGGLVCGAPLGGLG
jgi:hypothetical protein